MELPKVDAGVLRHFNKANGKTAPLSGGAKANLVMKAASALSAQCQILKSPEILSC